MMTPEPARRKPRIAPHIATSVVMSLSSRWFDQAHLDASIRSMGRRFALCRPTVSAGVPGVEARAVTACRPGSLAGAKRSPRMRFRHRPGLMPSPYAGLPARAVSGTVGLRKRRFRLKPVMSKVCDESESPAGVRKINTISTSYASRRTLSMRTLFFLFWAVLMRGWLGDKTSSQADSMLDPSPQKGYYS